MHLANCVSRKPQCGGACLVGVKFGRVSVSSVRSALLLQPDISDCPGPRLTIRCRHPHTRCVATLLKNSGLPQWSIGTQCDPYGGWRAEGSCPEERGQLSARFALGRGPNRAKSSRRSIIAHLLWPIVLLTFRTGHGCPNQFFGVFDYAQCIGRSKAKSRCAKRGHATWE